MNQEFKKVIKSKEWMNQVSETVVSHHANTAYTCNLLLWNASARRERPMWGSSQLTHYSYLYALGCHLQEGCNESHTPGALNAAHEHLQSGENSTSPKQEVQEDHTPKQRQKMIRPETLLTLEILLHHKTRVSIRAPILSTHAWKGSWA